MKWTPEAEDAIKKVPFFVRKRVRARVEKEAAAAGNERAATTLKSFVASIRHYVGAFLTVLEGADAIVFTGGIGENSDVIRAGVCGAMEWAGIRLDATANNSVEGEMKISAADSDVEIWVVPTNEEIVVARQTVDVIREG